MPALVATPARFPMKRLRSWFDAGRAVLFARLIAVGAVAGAASWLLTFALYPLFGTRPPATRELYFGIGAGATLGAILARVLSNRWASKP